MKRLTIITLLLGMLLVGSCQRGEKQQAEQVAKEFLDNLYAGNFNKARSYAGNEEVREFVSLIEHATQGEIEKGLTYRIVRTEQLQDTVAFHIEEIDKDDEGDTSSSVVKLLEVDGEWKVVSYPFAK